MKKYLNQANLPFLLLILVILKSFVIPSAVFDGVGIVALSTLFGFKLWMDYNQKPDPLKQHEDKLRELEVRVNSVSAGMDIKKQMESRFKF